MTAKTLFLYALLTGAACLASALTGCVVPAASGFGASSAGAPSATPRRGLFGLSDAAPAAPLASEQSSQPSYMAPLSAQRGRSGRARGGQGYQGGASAVAQGGASEVTQGGASEGAQGGASERAQGALSRATGGRSDLVKIEGNTWRTAVPATRVFSLIGRALSQTYLVSRVDRRNLTVQTEWDKFFIDGRLFRNRVVVSVFPVGPRQTEVVIRNNLEYFSGTPGRPEDMSESAWLPSPDITDEVVRLVDSVNVQIQNAALQRPGRSAR